MIQRRKVRAITLALAVLAAGCQDGGLTRAAAAGPVQSRLVQLPDGRQMNLHCVGKGSPTVLFEAGQGAGSEAWVKVQPAVARETRACAYDRAGYGFSDPGPLPRDGAAIARDLDQTLRLAGVDGPFIAVGHSAGGLYARLFAARRNRDVQGLVLLDPTIEQLVRPPAIDGLDGLRRRLNRCLATAQSAEPPPPGAPEWSGCVAKNADTHALAISRRPETWRSQLSELDSIFTSTSSQVYRLGSVLNETPIYILTASETIDRSPSIRPGESESAWLVGHRLIAAQSRLGWQRTLISSHLVMIDRPEAVTDAVLAMVRASRDNSEPAPLPPSETLPDLTSDLTK